MSELRAALRAVRTMRGDETPAFSATLYLDDVRVALVRSEGRGGAPRIDWIRPTDASLESRWGAWCAERAGVAPDADRAELWMAQEEAIFALFDDHEESRLLRRACRTKTLYRLEGDEPGSWRTIGQPFSEDLRTLLDARHGDLLIEIANERSPR